MALESEDLRSAAQAFQTYIQEVQDSVNIMQRAATDCMDNLGSDVFSNQAAARLQECVKNLSSTIQEAQDVQRQIQQKISELDELQAIL